MYPRNREKPEANQSRFVLNEVCFFVVSDETGGDENCSDEQFQCGSGGKCIPKRWQCDYHKDCENGEDEYDCRK